MDVNSISLPFAFLAGLVSFLSPCVLPVVPAYLTFVSGLTMDELCDGSVATARRTALLHATLFILGFLLVFMTLGASATAAGQAFNRILPTLSRLGGVVVIVFGIMLLDWVRLPPLARDLRVHLRTKPTGALGSIVVGIGLGVPFLVAAVGFNWFLTSLEVLRRWARPIQKVAGILLVVIGVLLVTGKFATVSASLADLGQWINLEL